jgi:GTP cyclohydrolase II
MSQIGMEVEEILNSESRLGKENHPSDNLRVEIAGVAELPTRFGLFHIYAFYNNKDGKEHAALVRGTVEGAENVPVRIHSECLTGDVLGSLRCDCRDQLEAALMALGKMDNGILLYMRQEGRGIGLANKIRAYGLQEHGFDTVEANLALGFKDDEREYSIAAQMLKALNVGSINLMTNNPRKIEDISRHGIHVNGRIPHVMEPNKYNRFYLETKATKSGHIIDFGGKERSQNLDSRPILVSIPSNLMSISISGD